MKKLIILTAFLLSTLSYAEQNKESKLNPVILDPTITQIYDGDTFFINIPGIDPVFGVHLGVRIYGIDAPEIRSTNKCERLAAIKAKAFLLTKVQLSKSVALLNVQRDKYFRILADVTFDDKLVRDEMISKKLAVPYYGAKKKKTNWCTY